MYENYRKDYKFFIKYCLPQFNFSSQKFVLFANEFYSNYFHWHEQLLGLITLQENDLLKDKKILMPNKYRNFKFIIESLKLLGIKDSDIVTIRKKSHIKAHELTFQKHGGFNPLLVNILREKLTKNVKVNENNFGDKIYISREGEKLRFVENEEEIMELLTKYGFKKVKMQNYSYQEQIQICHNAKYIIGPHGAGLTNILFMKNNSYVLELSTKQDYDFFTGFYFLANALNHSYLYQKCKIGSKSIVADSHHGSLLVDILQLEKNIKIMLDNND
jgi:capsular polysaccharide biosynthesis protein